MQTTPAVPVVSIPSITPSRPDEAAPPAGPKAQGLAELRRLASTARVFVSMPYVEGVSPRVLADGTRARELATDELVPRREGIFALDEIGLPVMDHGTLYGDAVFEGVLVAHGHLFTWREHLERLHASARSVGIDLPITDEHLTQALLEAVRATGVGNDGRGYVRLVVTRGLGDLGIAPDRCVGSTVYAICGTLRMYPEAAYRTGMGISVAREVRRPMADTLDPRVKSCNYLNNIRALVETRGEGCAETLMLTPSGFVAEATADNLFLVIRGAGWENDPARVRLVTPSADYCLNGITRALLMRAAAEAGYTVEESPSLLPADFTRPEREAFLTGTGAGVMPVTSVAGAPVGNGVPGPVTDALRARFQEYLADPGLGLSLDATADEVRSYLSTPSPAAAPNFVVELFRKIDSRDWVALEASLHEDVVYERPGYDPLVGRDRVLHFYREERVIAAGQHHLERVVIDGDSGACWGRFVGVHKNGSPIDERFADVYLLKDGRIHARRSFFFRPAV
ncbi:MAG TPA: aminotransferase class IV [Longimicrobium sp.]|nr:aminotransferase class IV [Longimicrobium sp.]